MDERIGTIDADARSNYLIIRLRVQILYHEYSCVLN
jgi:hypothetical protein